MIRKLIETPGKRSFYRVSKWLTIHSIYITPRHDLWDYAKNDDGCLDYINFHGDKIAINRFISRISPYGPLSSDYPDFIHGYDSENYFNPLFIELNEAGTMARLYLEV